MMKFVFTYEAQAVMIVTKVQVCRYTNDNTSNWMAILEENEEKKKNCKDVYEAVIWECQERG